MARRLRTSGSTLFLFAGMLLALFAATPAHVQGGVVYLDNAELAENSNPSSGLIRRELLRQAILIAAREGLGLQTRDAALREWVRPGESGKWADEAHTLRVSFSSSRATVSLDGPEAKTVWNDGYDDIKLAPDVPELIAFAEDLSRDALVNVLKNQGWDGKPVVWKDGAPAAPGTEALLAQLDDLSQLDLVRQTHALIHSDGESIERLIVLVRAYANLGRLTEFHWSVEHDVYMARSLLYAERLVHHEPRLKMAKWIRAYAEAMAGLGRCARRDLQDSVPSEGQDVPPWLGLVKPFYEFRLQDLLDAADAGDGPTKALGSYMAFLDVESAKAQGLGMKMAQSALKLNPNAIGLFDFMFENTGAGMANAIPEQMDTNYGNYLASRLATISGFPDSMAKIIAQQKAQRLPNRRQIVCEGLIDAGTPANDVGEPSWAAIARDVQETTFNINRRRMQLIADYWGQDASDEYVQIEPLIIDHPYRLAIKAIALSHSNNGESAAPIFDELSGHTQLLPICAAAIFFQARVDSPAHDNIWSHLHYNTDLNNIDLPKMMNINGMEKQDQASTGFWYKNLDWYSPGCPYSIAFQMRAMPHAQWKPDWETRYSNFPTVAWQFGVQYAKDEKWDEAEASFRKYLQWSPDYAGYNYLAWTYKRRGDDARWLAALEEFLSIGTDYGLQFAGAQLQIAQHLMATHRYSDAVKYADAAAETATAWALTLDVDARTRIGDYPRAEQVLREEEQHYSDYGKWLVWCVRTNKGDRQAATQEFERPDVIASREFTADGLLDIACQQYLNRKLKDASDTFDKRLNLIYGVNCLMSLLSISLDQHDAAKARQYRDDLHALATKDNKSINQLACRFADAMLDGGDDDLTNDAEVTGLLSKAEDNAAASLLCFWWAHHLQQINKADAALEFYKRTVRTSSPILLAQVMGYEPLRAAGIDPLEMEKKLDESRQQYEPTLP